jgi:prophage regulatory protein
MRTQLSNSVILLVMGMLGIEGGFDMYDIPQTGFLRLPQVLSVIPLGKTCWWEGVRAGRFPKPVKLSKRCTGWRAEDIHQLIKKLSDRAPINQDPTL